MDRAKNHRDPVCRSKIGSEVIGKIHVPRVQPPKLPDIDFEGQRLEKNVKFPTAGRVARDREICRIVGRNYHIVTIQLCRWG